MVWQADWVAATHEIDRIDGLLAIGEDGREDGRAEIIRGEYVHLRREEGQLLLAVGAHLHLSKVFDER